ncbi:MAG TPA: hypothetical protein VNO30_06635 [Kofleriaceae bacterium]|nr:hypothetical protein [Kofleriaceae bacterium]
MMGQYNYAYNLAGTPAVAIGEQLGDVVAASFLHAEGARRQPALVRACTIRLPRRQPRVHRHGALVAGWPPQPWRRRQRQRRWRRWQQRQRRR